MCTLFFLFILSRIIFNESMLGYLLKLSYKSFLFPHQSDSGNQIIAISLTFIIIFEILMNNYDIYINMLSYSSKLKYMVL